MKEITVRGAIGVTSSAYRNAIRLIESRRLPLERMHTHDFPLRDAEQRDPHARRRPATPSTARCSRSTE